MTWVATSLAAVETEIASAAFYPSCSAYHQTRAMPVIEEIDDDADLRRAVFGNIDDRVIATSIVQVLEFARQQSWQYGGYWDGAGRLPDGGFIVSNAADAQTQRI
jgi:hypothetical protein